VIILGGHVSTGIGVAEQYKRVRFRRQSLSGDWAL